MKQKLTGTTAIPALENQLVKYLTEQGYQVTKEVKLRGKSGVEHTFNLLAKLDDGFASYSVAFVISADADRENQLATIFNFANKAYDTGIRDRVLIAGTEYYQEAREFAQKQYIRIVDADQLEPLLDQKIKRPAVGTKAPVLKSKSDLVQTLSNYGYRVEEKASVKGRSGAKYVFDILAYADYGLTAHSLGIDIIGGDGVTGLGQVSLFDTKAYDVGIEHKALFVMNQLTEEAKRFAELQGIRIIEAPSVPSPSDTSPAKPAVKPEDSGKTGPEAKSLRQRLEPEAMQLIPEVMARRYNAIPISVSGNTLTLAMADQADIFAIEAFAAQSHKRIKPVAASAEEVRQAIDFNYKATGEIEEQLSRVSISNETSDDKLAIGAAIDAPLAQALNLIIEEAGFHSYRTAGCDSH